MATRITDHPTLGEFASFNDGGLSSGDTTNADARIFAQSADDEICITGLSGSFPNSRNVAEFEHNLWNKIDMVSDENVRWPHYHPEIPMRMGNIYDIDRFDAQFFGVHYQQADFMDPQGRILQERAYEAIIDAGINPRTIRGSRTGVFIGSCFAESEKTIFYENVTERGFGITGCSRAMMANRISYSLGLQGPSFLVDTACSSSLYALDMAFSHIRSGQCDAAIVGGANLLLRPEISLHFARLGVISKDGYCRSFDKDASGYVRSEAVATVFLQKAKDAKRIYAKLIYTKTNCDGYKDQGITFPSGQVQQNLLTEFYSDLRLDASQIGFVEAHSTGTVVGDPEECAALANVFCRNRKEPLLVGSVKSNMGHSESTSGVCSVAKMILAFERGEVPPNLHFVSNRPEIASLMENRIKVCTDVTKLPVNALVGINSFGFGGANAHALLQAYQKTKVNGGQPDDDIPRLVNWSGRTEDTISVMLDYLRGNPLDAEYIGLLQSIQSVEESNFLHRGFGVFAKGSSNDAPAVCLNSGEQRYEGVRRPLVWIFSGMGSQWPEMGSSLMVIPLFKESIAKSHAILKPFGIDLIQIISDPDKRISENILNSFVGIASIQIALVDVLFALDITPDYLIGHSVGELGCAYADGVINQEQMLLSAYYRGIASVSTNVIHGSMAAIGIGHSVIRDILPSDIEMACHNSAESTTISGPSESVAKFVAELTSQNIFAREVRCSNIAYHSRYVAEIGTKLLELSKDLYLPKRRSDKWLSTSVPQSDWNEPKNRISNAEYYTNNLLNSVLFEETTALLPTNAIAIEIAPHGLLQAIVKRSMPNTTHIPLTQRGSSNNAAFFLAAIGKLYMHGWTMPIEKLYPPINYPVSRGTAKISPLLRWDHSVPLFVSKFELNKTPESGERRVKVNVSNEDCTYIAGHMIDGRCLLPATGYLDLVWETLAMMKGTEKLLLNVEFEDIQFLRATTLQPDTDVELTIMIHYGNGSFEVSEGITSIVTGVIRVVTDIDAVLTELPPLDNSSYPMLNKEDFYKELRLRGYEYNGEFKSVSEARSDGLYGRIQWNGNWVSFMDCILQSAIFSKDTRSLMVPTRAQKIRIFPKEHFSRRILLQGEHQGFDVYMHPELDIIQAGGVEIIGMITNGISRRKDAGEVVLETYKFVPHSPALLLTRREAYRFCVQLVVENNHTVTNFKVLEIKSSVSDEYVVTVLQEVIDEIPLITNTMTLLTDQEVELPNVAVVNNNGTLHTNVHILVLSDAQLDTLLIETSQNTLVNQGFVIVTQPLKQNEDWLSAPGLNIIARIPTETMNIYLLRRKPSSPTIRHVIDISKSNEFDWIEKVQIAVKTQSILLVAQHNQFSGILGLVNCIRREAEMQDVSCVFIDDETAPPFDLTHPLYANQLSLNLAINVYRDGSWGSYRHQRLIQEKELKTQSSHFYANVLRQGDLSSFCWLQGPLNHETNDQLVRIQYAAINFKDVMLATGRLSVDIFNLSRIDKECVLGFEYAGATQSGQKVMGMVGSGAMGTLTQPYAPLTWNVPSEWSLQEAATVPVAYITVYCAFFMGKAISAGKSILIHAGSGGVGLAAIRVALAYNMEVFTTVSNNTKKKYILDLFPKLKESNIGNSRDCTFERLIKLRTRGKGVDYVLNSLSDEKLQASIRCLGRAGVFLEIGKFDMSNDTKMGLGVFLKEMTFRSVLAENLFLQSPEETLYIHGLIERDLTTGIIQPLKSTVFQMDEIEKAYRFMSTGQHIGKVLIQVRQNATDELTLAISSLPRAHFDADKVYIVAGGLGGLGLEFVDWFIMRGARKIVINSSRGLSSTYQSYRIRVWENYGSRTIISTADISTAEGCQQLIREAQSYGHVDGIFNLAACLRDGMFVNQNTKSFIESAAPKSGALFHLDEISRKMLLDLKYFVVFSSISCGRGNAGQSNYGMTNSAMERIIEKRVSDGLSGKAIQWGAIGEVGLLAHLPTDMEIKISGTVRQRISSCINVMDTLLTSSDAVVGSMVLVKTNELASSSGKKASLFEMVLKIMSIQNTSSISMTTSLAELGIDSLMTIEIKQVLERDFDIFLSTQELRAMTFQTVQKLSNAGTESKFVVSKSDTHNMTNLISNFTNLLINEQYNKPNEETIYRLLSKITDSSFADRVLILPGVEGDTSPVWRSVCKQLNAPTFIAKFHATWNQVSALEMAKIYAQLYLDTIPPHKKFFVIGYSFGTLVAIEIVRILEATGLRGHLVCIDGAPAFLKKLVLKLMNVDDQLNLPQLEKTILCNIAKKYLPTTNLDKFNDRLDTLIEWPNKLAFLLDLLATYKCNVDEHLLSESVTGLYNRTLSSYFYPITDKIHSNITLIRATQPYIADIDEMYELQAHTEGTVSLQYVDGSHLSVMESFSLVNIINQLLTV